MAISLTCRISGIPILFDFLCCSSRNSSSNQRPPDKESSPLANSRLQKANQRNDKRIIIKIKAHLSPTRLYILVIRVSSSSENSSFESWLDSSTIYARKESKKPLFSHIDSLNNKNHKYPIEKKKSFLYH